MRQESTSGEKKQARGAGARGAWRRILSVAGPVAVGVAGLAAAAGVGYLQGEKIGAAKAVAREIFTRQHSELREIQAGVEIARQKLSKIHNEERRALKEISEQSHQKEGAASSNGAPASADQGAAPSIYTNPEPGDRGQGGVPAPDRPGRARGQAPRHPLPRGAR